MDTTELALIIARLRRIEGHLGAVITMIGEGRSSLELAQQLHAVERAIAGTKREFIHGRIEACLTAAAVVTSETKSWLSEIRSLGKYL